MAAPESIEVAQAVDVRLAFNGQALQLFALDGMLWILADQLEHLVQHACPRSGRYYSRWLSPWSTRVAQIHRAGVPSTCARVFTLHGAEALASRFPTPAAAAFVNWVHALASSPTAPPGAFLSPSRSD